MPKKKKEYLNQRNTEYALTSDAYALAPYLIFCRVNSLSFYQLEKEISYDKTKSWLGSGFHKAFFCCFC